MEHIESHTGRFIGSLAPQSVKSATFRFSSKHVLYGRLRPYLNKATAPDFEGHCSTEIFPIKPSPVVDRHFLLYWLLADETTARINETCSGARMPRADMNEVLGFDFPLPPLPEQRRIVALLDAAVEGIATATANAERNLQNARDLFESHLAEVFSRRGEGWVETTIGAEIKFIDYRGKTPVKTSSGVRLITAKNVRMGYLQANPTEFIAADSYAGWMTRGIPRKGDVLFTTEAPLANVAQLDTDERVAFAQRIIIMQPKAESLDSTFLKYLLLSQPVQHRIRTKATGATVQGIKASLLKLVEISFPKSRKTQSEIVDKLGDLHAGTQRLSQIYEQKQGELVSLKKSLLHQAFSGAL
ncbi:MAG: restriction endonuclease subunit S [Phycisphaera sp.]|nr:restriction endonuclease subunit S [Phycisphaera sp.]